MAKKISKSTRKTPKKHPGGRPTKYKPEYCDEIVEFFSTPPYREVEITHRNKDGSTYTTYEDKPNDLPFLSQFARHIDVNTDTLLEWRDKHPEFSVAYKKAKDLQKEFLATNAVRGLTNTTFSIFTAKNITDWRDVKEIKQEVKQESTVKVESVEIEDRLEQIKKAKKK